MTQTAELTVPQTERRSYVETPGAPRRRRSTLLAVGAAAVVAAASIAVLASDSSETVPAPMTDRMTADAEDRWRANDPIATPAPTGGDDVDLRCISATVTADAAERCIANR